MVFEVRSCFLLCFILITIYTSLRPGNTVSFEELLQRRRAVVNSGSNLTDRKLEPQTFPFLNVLQLIYNYTLHKSIFQIT